MASAIASSHMTSSHHDGSSSDTNHILEAYDLLSSTRAHHIRSALGSHVTAVQPINATTSLVSFDTRAHGNHLLTSHICTSICKLLVHQCCIGFHVV
jgi:hypothetical protein